MTTLASYPQELVDSIIDFLWDDTQALKICSLVCHRWLPSTRHHLFSTTRLDLTQQSVTRNFLSHFHNFNGVQRPCTFSGSIRRLKLHISNPTAAAVVDKTTTYNKSGEPLPPFDYLIYLVVRKSGHASVTHLIPGLQELSFMGMKLELSPMMKDLFHRMVQGITILDLTKTRFRDVVELMTLVSSIQSLAQLSLVCVAFQESTSWQTPGVLATGRYDTALTERGLPTGLAKLVIADVPVVVYDFLVSRPKLPHIHTLSVSSSSSPTPPPPSMKALVSRFGPHLRQLEVSYYDAYSPTDPLPASFVLDFSRLTQLESLHFVDIYPQIVPGSYRQSIPALLTSLPSRVQEIFFDCRFIAQKNVTNMHSVPNFMPWAKLAEALSLPKFDSLKVVCFICAPMYQDMFRRKVHQKMNALYKGGIVSVMGLA